MKVLFSNPPWWEKKEGRFWFWKKHWRVGVRAGSRWPFTYLSNCSPDNFKFGEYLPYPFFMGYATTYAKKETGSDVRFRDSIALRESYNTYFRHLEEERYDYIFDDCSRHFHIRFTRRNKGGDVGHKTVYSFSAL